MAARKPKRKAPKRIAPSKVNEARARKTDQRVGELLDLISAGAHFGRSTLKRKAEEWGLSLSQAYHLDAMAYRHLRLMAEKDPDLKTRIFERIHGLMNAAMGRTKLERRKNRASPSGYDLIKVPDPDFKSALRAAELLGREVGMFRQQIDVTQKTELSGLSDEQLEALAETGELPEDPAGNVVH